MQRCAQRGYNGPRTSENTNIAIDVIMPPINRRKGDITQPTSPTIPTTDKPSADELLSRTGNILVFFYSDKSSEKWIPWGDSQFDCSVATVSVKTFNTRYKNLIPFTEYGFNLSRSASFHDRSKNRLK